ncbi:MAG: class I SAM-dependent methyltransferase, partial [Chlorobiales bacterium]|nr:class I SAM-dependent methyltransferase [Chlorobiales bacterium]
FLKQQVDGAPFGFVFDRGCFHSFDSAEERRLFAENVGAHLGKGGLWLSLIANADAPQRDPGPPRLSAAEIVFVIEPFFEIRSLVSGHLDSNRPDPVRCWVCMMKKRPLD